MMEFGLLMKVKACMMQRTTVSPHLLLHLLAHLAHHTALLLAAAAISMRSLHNLNLQPTQQLAGESGLPR